MRPTPAEERWLTLAARLGADPQEPPFTAPAAGWRTAQLLSCCVLFVLGMIAAAALAAFLDLLHLPAAFAVAGLLAISVAEWLILGRRHFFSGLEEALESTGLLLVAFQCSEHLSHARAVAACLLGAALGIAGLRLLNPLLTTLAVLAFALAVDARLVGLGSYAAALVALAAGAVSFSRPAHDRMLDALVIALPVAGYLWLSSGGAAAADYRHAAPAAWLVPLCPPLFAAIAAVVGIRRRTHAPLIAAMLCVACTAYELRNFSGWPTEMSLLVWGSVLLVASVALERWPRAPRAGITSRAPARGDEGLLAAAGGAILAPQATPPSADHSFSGSGGRFGGGGASGRY